MSMERIDGRCIACSPVGVAISVHPRFALLRFQNAIETWLYFANMIVIVLGACYTLLNIVRVDAGLQRATEYTMITLLATSCGGAALYLSYGWCAPTSSEPGTLDSLSYLFGPQNQMLRPAGTPAGCSSGLMVQHRATPSES